MLRMMSLRFKECPHKHCIFQMNNCSFNQTLGFFQLLHDEKHINFPKVFVWRKHLHVFSRTCCIFYMIFSIAFSHQHGYHNFQKKDTAYCSSILNMKHVGTCLFENRFLDMFSMTCVSWRKTTCSWSNACYMFERNSPFLQEILIL